MSGQLGRADTPSPAGREMEVHTPGGAAAHACISSWSLPAWPQVKWELWTTTNDMCGSCKDRTTFLRVGGPPAWGMQ